MSDFSLSQQEVSAKLGVAQSTLSNKLRLLKLTREQREKILSAKLKERHARAIIRLPENLRDEALNRIIAEQLSLSETEELIEKMLQPHGESVKPLRLGKIGDIRIFSNSISRIIGTMRRSGLDAKSRKNETDSYIEYTIIIPKERDVTH